MEQEVAEAQDARSGLTSARLHLVPAFAWGATRGGRRRVRPCVRVLRGVPASQQHLDVDALLLLADARAGAGLAGALHHGGGARLPCRPLPKCAGLVD